MGIILRLAERTISRRFFQSLLFIFGIALGVAMIIAIDVANGSAKRAFNLSTASITGATTHQIIGGVSGLPNEFYREIRAELGIPLSAPVIEEYVRVAEFDNQVMRLLGVDVFSEAPFRPYLNSIQVSSNNTSEAQFNALNRFIAQSGTALITNTISERYGYQAGDIVTVRAGALTFPVEIIGILTTNDSVSQQALDDLLLVDIATAQEITAQTDTISRIDLILPADQADAIIAQIEERLPTGARVGSVVEQSNALSQMTDAFELNLQALSLLALIVGAFLIYNTVTFSVIQRRGLIGIMRAIGMTQQQIFAQILIEAIILAVIGTILGLGLGMIFGRGAVSLVARTISDLYFNVNVQQIVVPSWVLVKGASMGIVASVIAALLPAWSATRTPPAGVMRRSDQETSAQKSVPFITLIAILMIGLGIIILNLPIKTVEASFTGLFSVIIGGAFFTPLVLIIVMRLATPITERLFGVVGRMAPRAVERSLSRTSIAVAALTIAVSVIVGVSGMISSFRNTIGDWLSTTLVNDLYISPPLLTSNQATVNLDPAITDLILSVEGVEAITTTRTVSVSAPDYPDLPDVHLQALSIDPATSRRFVWNNSDDYHQALADGGLVVSESFAFRRDITQDNNTLRLLTDQGVQTFEVVAVSYDYTTDQGRIYMSDAVYRTYFNDHFISSVGTDIESSANLQTVMSDLRETLRGYDVGVQSNRELRDSVFVVFDNAFAITIALRLLAMLVAFIGILSALLSLQLENTRQYGVLRANGMTPRQLWNFTILQTGLMGFVAGLLAIPIGLALAVILIYVINVRSFGWTMELHWLPREFLEAFMVALIASIAAGIYPAIRMMRLVTARALRSE
jgi:putative ABC transport system permease protein